MYQVVTSFKLTIEYVDGTKRSFDVNKEAYDFITENMQRIITSDSFYFVDYYDVHHVINPKEIRHISIHVG